LAAVDTAAQVSVMSRRIFERLEPRPKLTTTTMLKAAGECSEMEARVSEKVVFRIGQIKNKWNMVVAEKTDDVILGIYFLEHQKAVINLTDYSIELRGEKIPSTVISTEHKKKMKIYRVKLAKNTIVPPCSDKISVAEFDETPDNNIVLQPTQFMKGLLIP
jgi:predicted aspartyl protease